MQEEPSIEEQSKKLKKTGEAKEARKAVDKELNKYGFGIPTLRRKKALKRLKAWWAENNANTPFPTEKAQIDALVKREILAETESIRTKAGMVLRYGRPNYKTDAEGNSYYDKSPTTLTESQREKADQREAAIQELKWTLLQEIPSQVMRRKQDIREALQSLSRKPEHDFIYDELQRIHQKYGTDPKLLEAVLFRLMFRKNGSKLFTNVKETRTATQQAEHYVYQASLKELRTLMKALQKHNETLIGFAKQKAERRKQYIEAYHMGVEKEDLEDLKTEISQIDTEYMRVMGQRSDTIRDALQNPKLSPEFCSILNEEIPEYAEVKLEEEALQIAAAYAQSLKPSAAKKVLAELQKSTDSIQRANQRIDKGKESARRSSIRNNWIRTIVNNPDLTDNECATIAEELPHSLEDQLKKRNDRDRSRRQPLVSIA